MASRIFEIFVEVPAKIIVAPLKDGGMPWFIAICMPFLLLFALINGCQFVGLATYAKLTGQDVDWIDRKVVPKGQGRSRVVTFQFPLQPVSQIVDPHTGQPQPPTRGAGTQSVPPNTNPRSYGSRSPTPETSTRQFTAIAPAVRPIETAPDPLAWSSAINTRAIHRVWDRTNSSSSGRWVNLSILDSGIRVTPENTLTTPRFETRREWQFWRLTAALLTFMGTDQATGARDQWRLILAFDARTYQRTAPELIIIDSRDTVAAVIADLRVSMDKWADSESGRRQLAEIGRVIGREAVVLPHFPE